MTLSDSFATLRPFIDEATATSLAHLLARAGTSDRSEEFSRAVLASVSGGKRFRALMAHVGYALSSGTSVAEVSLPYLSAALELYQASALVHDDIIDKADERRGMPTPHRTLANYHTAQSWIGSSTDFGRHGAILVGDFLFSAATA
ncbi:MAG: polyprenyl synthetase family protein, partial [Schaalia odontolytica]